MALCRLSSFQLRHPGLEASFARSSPHQPGSSRNLKQCSGFMRCLLPTTATATATSTATAIIAVVVVVVVVVPRPPKVGKIMAQNL